MLPIEPVVLPASLVGVPNGQLPATLLETVPGWGTGQRLHPSAARSWRALVAAATRDGVPLTCTGTYRSLEDQRALFLARYSPAPLPGRPSKRWNGQTWWLKRGEATAATPGSSNHGYGLAVDAGAELDGDPEPESIDAATLTWLLAHAPSYGWSWELQSEAWHLRYVAGDALPVALHAAAPDPAPHPAEDANMALRTTTTVKSLRNPNRRVVAEVIGRELVVSNGAVKLADWPAERTRFPLDDYPWLLGDPWDIAQDGAELVLTCALPDGDRPTYGFPIVP